MQSEEKQKHYFYRAHAPNPEGRPPWSGFTVTPEIETWPPMQWTPEEIQEDEDEQEMQSMVRGSMR